VKVSIIGSGYVGLVTGACLADMQNNVTCLDIDEDKVKSLSLAQVPIFEPGLAELVKKNIDLGYLEFTSSYNNILDTDLFFICVDTPNDSTNKPNLTNLDAVCKTLSQLPIHDATIVLKSTVPLGTNNRITNFFLASGLAVDVVSNPEFLREGSAINDFMRPERIIIGSSSTKSVQKLQTLYRPFSRKSNKIISMSPASAELSKYAANSFLATKISFMNEIAEVAEKTGANMHEVRQGVGSDSRIGDQFLYAGLGYGGSCFPKDINALIHFQSDQGIKSNILQATHEQNSSMEYFFTKKLLNYFPDPSKTKLLFWGLSFKPNTDDIRESIAIKIITALAPEFLSIGVYDPKSLQNAKEEMELIPNLLYLDNKYEQIDEYDALVICTEWKEFWNPDFSRLASLKSKAVFDGRNILSRDEVEENDLLYFGIGT